MTINIKMPSINIKNLFHVLQAETREKERNERIAMREKMRAETSGENRAPYRADRPDFDRRRPVR